MSTSEPVDLSGLPRLKETIGRYGLNADKKLGQHFLLDPMILSAIAASAGDIHDARVIEIGPGPGGLTRALLEAGARLTAIERDSRCVRALGELVEAARGRLELIDADALDIDTDALAGGEPYRIIANLPYNVGNELLVRWLTGAQRLIDMRLMFQREVVDRICAVPRTSAYGRLSILCQTICEVRRVMDLPAGAFHPPPKVRSALVALTPRYPRLDTSFIRSLERVTAAAFQQRRKMLRSSLKPLGLDVERLLDGTGVAPTMRAEEVDVARFGLLADRVLRARQGPS
ncbi:MAG: 16S rRNA (adenine(1518)-N(6)/adenine(1519)-N(6))-dimethyltransferase RsmA [Geminicoccaceae bacterium]